MKNSRRKVSETSLLACYNMESWILVRGCKFCQRRMISITWLRCNLQRGQWWGDNMMRPWWIMKFCTFKMFAGLSPVLRIGVFWGLREQIFAARIDWNILWELIFEVSFSSSETSERKEMFFQLSTFLSKISLYFSDI